jgi:hypothetical protein
MLVKDGLLPARVGRPPCARAPIAIVFALMRSCAAPLDVRRRGERVIDAEVLNDHRP